MLACAIVETRATQNLIGVIKNHLKFLPSNTTLYLFGSSSVAQLLYEEKIKCKFFEIDITSIHDYNALLTSRLFWDSIIEENVLVFQHDSLMLRSGIEEFYEYDFVGAPLYHISFPRMNGGFSFRKKSAMLKCLESFAYPFGLNEDMYFCESLEKLNAKLPTIEVAKKFSVETIFGLGSLGIHAIEKWLTEEQVFEIKNQYNEKQQQSK